MLALITDRTQADVTYATQLAQIGIADMTPSELQEFLGGLKGSYNATDLNRVGQAMQYLVGILNSDGYSVTISPKTDWQLSDVPNQTSISTYLNNLTALRAALPLPSQTPEVPASADALTYVEANNIEEILLAIEQAIINYQNALFYCGEIQSGEV